MFEELNAKLKLLVADIGALKPELMALLQERRSEVAQIEKMLAYVDELQGGVPSTKSKAKKVMNKVSDDSSSNCSTGQEILKVK